MIVYNLKCKVEWNYRGKSILTKQLSIRHKKTIAIFYITELII